MQSLTKSIDAAIDLLFHFVQIYVLHFRQFITCAMYTKINKQAGAELGQAQLKLGLDFTFLYIWLL